jgi:hypothetical protein
LLRALAAEVLCELLYLLARLGVDPGGPDDREEFCEACGRQLVYVITWGDDSGS